MSLKSAKSLCFLAAVASGFLVSGCATWSSSEVTKVRPTVQETKQVSADKILLIEGDISDRPYAVLGDISVTVNKTTLFHPEPTREMIRDKLREEAAKLGADAVTHVRYGTIGISLMSWGSLDGKGRAVSFTR